ncbi:MAG: IS110 family transposase [Oscillospiraceae bacterium]|nr:IS110 family transposase [Oscillospiraceae bacterium]
MAKYTVSSDYGSMFGMDVHARSVTVKGFDWATGEERTKRFGDCPAASEIAEWMEANFTGPYYAAYESGCTGFHLCRQLRKLGVDCDVIAVTSIARSNDDKRRKTDKRDAGRILSEILSPKRSFSVVWVPDPECEAARDLARARHDAAMALTRAKLQTTALLLRHGFVWNEKTPAGNLKSTWRGDFDAWIAKIDLGDDVDNEVLAFYRECALGNLARLQELDKKVLACAERPRWKPYVDAFVLIRGIDVQTAFLLAAEFGDFLRFPNGRSVSKWLGTVPSEHSSGDSVVHGRITKAGNSHCRSALVEGVTATCGRSLQLKRPKPGHEVSPSVLAHCHAASKRTRSRYNHLAKEAKIGENKARVAVVSELARWVWSVGCMVQEEQRSS